MFWIELVAAVLSALGVWLTVKRRPWCWPIGLVSVLVYAWVFIDAKLYSDALLQVAFATLLVYGWWRWMQHLGADGRVVVVGLPWRNAVLHLAVGALGALTLGALMRFYTDADLPWLDAALAGVSLVAQWWQARRHAAAWWLWIAVDVVYIGVYVHKDLLITAVLYIGFLAMAAAGLRSWHKARCVNETASIPMV